MTRKYRLATKWRLAVVDFDLSAPSICRRAGLPADLLESPDAWVTGDEYIRLWEAFVAETSDPLIGLRIGQWMTTETFEPAMFAAYCSPDLKRAIQRVAKYKQVVCPVTTHVVESQGGLQVSFEGLRGRVLPFQSAVAMVVSCVHHARRATRSEVRPLKVVLPPGAPSWEAYNHFFGVEVQAAPAASVLFSHEDSVRPFLTEKPAFWRFLEPALRARMRSMSDETRVVDVVHNRLVELLPAGRTQIADVAAEMGIGTRTLQRRLSMHGTSFQDVLHETRERLARHYLADSDLCVEEISLLLGYENPSSLYRAFHKWTGTTPEAYRESGNSGEPPTRSS